MLMEVTMKKIIKKILLLALILPILNSNIFLYSDNNKEDNVILPLHFELMK